MAVLDTIYQNTLGYIEDKKAFEENGIKLSDISNAYNSYLLGLVDLIAGNAAIVALGARPTYPVIITTDSDWNSVVANQLTYDSSFFQASNQATQGNTEVINAVSKLITVMPSGQWFQVTTSGSYTIGGSSSTTTVGSGTTVYIGYIMTPDNGLLNLYETTTKPATPLS